MRNPPGGFGFACGYDIERKFRETRLYQGRADLDEPHPPFVAEHVLGLLWRF